jgi:hypothetical protein
LQQDVNAIGLVETLLVYLMTLGGEGGGRRRGWEGQEGDDNYSYLQQ